MNLSSKPLRSKDLEPDLNTEPILKTHHIINSALTDTIQEGKEYANSCFPLFSKTANRPPDEPPRGTCVCAGGGDSAQVFPLLSNLFLPFTHHLHTVSYSPTWQKKKKRKRKKRKKEKDVQEPGSYSGTHEGINQIPRVWDKVCQPLHC